MTDLSVKTLPTSADDGDLTEIDGGWELRFERRLRHSPERVWKALTTPEGLKCWLAEADIDPVPGGGTHLTLVHRIPAAWKDARRNVLSGWVHHMEGLDDAVQGVAHSWDWDRWFALRDAYAARIDAQDAAA